VDAWMGAIDRNGYRFEPEFSVIKQNGAVHVYKNGEFLEEIKFSFEGKYPVLNDIERIVDDYCDKKGI
jgi:Family of unknown function (DUF5370)